MNNKYVSWGIIFVVAAVLGYVAGVYYTPKAHANFHPLHHWHWIDQNNHDQGEDCDEGFHFWDDDCVAPAPQTGGLVVIKTFGTGTTTPDQFSFTLNDGTPIPFNVNGENDFSNMATGTYSIAEVATSSYTGNTCDVTVTEGATSTCTITNNLVTPPPIVCGENQSLVDGQCVDNPVTPPPSDTSSGSSDNGGGGGGGGWSGNGGCPTYANGQLPPWGVVPCATTTPPVPPASCSPLLTAYLRMGRHNDPAQVMLLQAFLNSNLGVNMPVNGIFDGVTDAFVRQFQDKYASEILSPWHLNHNTGIVWLTTRKLINKLNCATVDEVLPPLTPWVN
jgi:hypothetical protein